MNGCGMVIEMDDGTIIVPYALDTSLLLADGQEVEITYTVITDINYTCGAGLLAKISWLEMVGCGPVIMESIHGSSLPLDFPANPFRILSAEINNDCLAITLSYSGGCGIHEFIMSYSELPSFSPYTGTLTLSHNAHRDMCEAWITKTISYDLTALQRDGSDMVRLSLKKAGDPDYRLVIDYYYK